jgi:hypothetical protein
LIETLALEAETAITILDINKQNYYRHAVAKKIKDISKNNKINNKKSKEEWKQIMNIKTKLIRTDIVTRAGKGKTLVILTKEEYNHKIQNFIPDNHLIKMNINPTHKYQKIIKQCNNIIQKEHKWTYINMNPIAPNLYATIKLHKENKPNRPILNWKNAPAYELANQVSKTLHNYLELPYTYNIQNSIQLMTDLKFIELNKDTRLCSFDITNMYTNISKI